MNGKLGREEECGEKREERERIFNYIYLNFFEFSLSLSLSRFPWTDKSLARTKHDACLQHRSHEGASRSNYHSRPDRNAFVVGIEFLLGQWYRCVAGQP